MKWNSVLSALPERTANRNGWSHRNSLRVEGPIDVFSLATAAVPAAASVPASFTTIVVLCNTAPTQRSDFPVMPAKEKTDATRDSLLQTFCNLLHFLTGNFLTKLWTFMDPKEEVRILP